MSRSYKLITDWEFIYLVRRSETLTNIVRQTVNKLIKHKFLAIRFVAMNDNNCSSSPTMDLL